MKHYSAGRVAWLWWLSLTGLGMLPQWTPELAAQPLLPPATAPAQTEADLAWEEIVKLSQAPLPPEEWQTKKPSPEAVAEFRARMAEQAGLAADKARDFYRKYPQHPKAAQARRNQLGLLNATIELGSTSRRKQFEALEAEFLKDPSLSEDERFALRSARVRRRAFEHESEGIMAVLNVFEKEVRELQKDFPKRPEVYVMLREIAAGCEADKAKGLLDEIAASPVAPPEIKQAAVIALKQYDLLDKKLELKFTATNERPVDLTRWQGKVVLVDFWATWCPPCMRELPKVVAAYERFHSRGFEVVGINLDESQEAMTAVTTKAKMVWPQYNDGKVWNSEFIRGLGVVSLPTMWLVDKKGNLRELKAQNNLEAKVEKLLGEP